jgi:nucleoside-diphosphate-sugar epimerase
MRVLVTGAGGRIGARFITSRDAADLDIVATDVRGEGRAVGHLDVTDRNACRDAVAGVDAVLHLAADPSPAADFERTVLPLNVLATHHLATAAVDAGVGRFVYASSIQAVAGYPLDHQPRESDAPRPRTDYGVGKAAGEALCASLAVTSTTTFVSVRLGHYGVDRPSPAASLRDRMAWLSSRDANQLLGLALRVPLDGHLVVHGVSDNHPKQLSIDATRRALGYAPMDDAFA